MFAIGVLAYQLLTGRLPFDQGILGIVDDGTTQHVPAAIDRWDRPSAVEVLGDLGWIGDALTTPIHTRPPAAGQLHVFAQVQAEAAAM